jgi:hypothetical protein
MRYHPDFIMCAFCEDLVAIKWDYTKTQYCKDCNDYKGLITVREFHEQYGSETLVPSWAI